MPVGQADETVARNLSSDAVFFAHYIVLNETKYFVTILGRNEKVLVAVEVIGERVALVPSHPPCPPKYPDNPRNSSSAARGYPDRRGTLRHTVRTRGSRRSYASSPGRRG